MMMKINKLQRSINTSSLVIVLATIITLILCIYTLNFIYFLVPISISYLILLIFDLIEYYIKQNED
jgi:hypothetical protein